MILDEADTLEHELMRWISVKVTQRTCVRYGLREPSRRTVADSWREWLDDAVPRLTFARDKIQGEDVRSQRERDRLTRLLAKLRTVRKELRDSDEDCEGGESGWVYSGDGGTVEFKPVSVRGYGRLLWGLGQRFLLMSATVISPGAMLDELGWEKPFSVVKVDSTFPRENRPVVYSPAARMTNKNDESGKLVPALEQIIRRHAKERVLVHCVSYRLASYLHGELSRSCGELGVECATYTGSDGKSDAVDRFRRSEGGVLIAPSLDRGIDLPDDDCRVVVIAKVPYPYLGDRQVSARLHSKGGQTWYTVQTVRSIVQMTGRGVRHKDDYCTSYILDGMFDDLWSKARGLFPKWWMEAIKWDRR